MIRLSKQEAKKLGIKKQKPEEKKGRDNIESNPSEVYACLEIPIAPQSKHRPRSFVDEKSIATAFKASQGNIKKFMSMVKTRTVTTQKTREFETQVANYARALMGTKKPYDKPCELKIHFFINGSEKQWPVSIRDGDLDNHEKALCDALNQILYTDDRLIVKKTSMKTCTEDEPKIIVYCITNPETNI